MTRRWTRGGHPVLVLLALLLSDSSHAADASVSVEREHWMALLPPTPDRPERPPGPRVVGRTVTLTPDDEGVALTVAWALDAEAPGWLDVDLATGIVVDDVALDGRRAPVSVDDDDITHLTAWVDGTASLRLRGRLAGARSDAASLALLPAPRGSVVVQTDRLAVLTSEDGGVARVGDRFWTGAEHLSLALRDPAPQARGVLAVGAVGLGLTVGDAELTGRARVRWELARGAMDRVSLVAEGVGDDLQLTGPLVASWSRSGRQIDVVLREPADTLVALELSWTRPLADGVEARAEVPTIVPGGVFRTTSTVQVARDGEVEVVPELALEPVAADALPEWGRDLVTGTPTSAWRGADAARGSLGLFRFTPVSGPPTIVDVAAYTIATTDEGRLLVQARYQVRNERGAWLRVVPPPGTRILGARVAGETAFVGADGDAWLVPLDKSVETVEGLLSFPVEVVLLGEEAAWDRSARRQLPLPRVDAPVAVTRTTVYLPPGYANRLRTGDDEVVADFTEGESIGYGFALGTEEAAADEAFQQAVDAWMRNDFQAAQSQLDDLRDMGATNENIDRLQANLDMLGAEGTGSGGGGVALERRIREQAKARSGDARQQQERTLQEAEQALLAGSYEEAEIAYKAALDIGEELDKLEQTESVEVEESNALIAKQVDQARKAREKVEAERKKQSDEAERARAAAEARRAAEEAQRAEAEADRRMAEEESRKAEEAVRARAAERAAAEAAAAEEATSRRATLDLDGTLAAPVTVEIDGEFLSRVPAGRSYQSAIDEITAPEQPVVVTQQQILITEDAPPPPPSDVAIARRAGPRLFGSKNKAVPPAAPAPALPAGPSPQGQAIAEALLPRMAAALSRVQGLRYGVTDAGMARCLDGHAADIAGFTKRVERATESPDALRGLAELAEELAVRAATCGASSTRDAKPRDRKGDRSPTSGFISIDLADEEEFLEPVVTATSLSTVVPALGEAVRYQHLLLPAGSDHAVTVRARRTQRKP